MFSLNGEVTSDTLAESLNIAYQSAGANLRDLLNKGFLNRRLVKGKHKNYYVYSITDKAKEQLSSLPSYNDILMND